MHEDFWIDVRQGNCWCKPCAAESDVVPCPSFDIRGTMDRHAHPALSCADKEKSRGGTSTHHVDPDVMVGKPVVRGTRITVELVIGLLAQGWIEQDVLSAYPHLTHDDVLACLAYAQDVVSSEKVYPTAAA